MPPSYTQEPPSSVNAHSPCSTPSLRLTPVPFLPSKSTLRVQATIERPISFGTQPNGSCPRIGAARDWIASEMRTYATRSKERMTVTIPNYVQGPTSRVPNDTMVSNVVATLQGSKDPSRAYTISGHYNTRVSDVLNLVNDAPDTNGDASGVAIFMELARVMASHPPAAPIIFAAVAAEEQGLPGSNFLATQLKAARVDVQGNSKQRYRR